MGKDFGWLTTGRDIEALNLLEAIYRGTQGGRIAGRLSFLFLNREEGEGPFSDRIISSAHEWNIPLVRLSSSKFKPEMRLAGAKEPKILKAWREEYHLKVVEMIKDYKAAFFVLAGYMLIIGKSLCTRYTLINLHPAPPHGPVGTWQEVIWQLIKMRAETSGVMIHKVTPALDQGPPITYCLFPTINDRLLPLWREMEKKLKTRPLEDIIREEGEENRLFQAIRQEGVRREQPLLFETIGSLCTGELEVKDKGIFFQGKLKAGGLCLNEKIESGLAI